MTDLSLLGLVMLVVMLFAIFIGFPIAFTRMALSVGSGDTSWCSEHVRW